MRMDAWSSVFVAFVKYMITSEEALQRSQTGSSYCNLGRQNYTLAPEYNRIETIIVKRKTCLL